MEESASPAVDHAQLLRHPARSVTIAKALFDLIETYLPAGSLLQAYDTEEALVRFCSHNELRSS
jgi:hypothetical protein